MILELTLKAVTAASRIVPIVRGDRHYYMLFDKKEGFPNFQNIWIRRVYYDTSDFGREELKGG